MVGGFYAVRKGRIQRRVVEPEQGEERGGPRKDANEFILCGYGNGDNKNYSTRKEKHILN